MSRISGLVLVITILLAVNAFAYEIEAYRCPAKTKSLNLVVVGLDYPDKNTFLGDMKTIDNAVLQTRPFSEVKNSINMFYIVLNKEEAGTFLMRSDQEMPPIRVRMDFMQAISRKANPYKLVILEWRGNSACAELSAIDKISLVILGRSRYSNDIDFLKGFLHELGHSLGLRDECIDCPGSEPGYPNCAPTRELAEKWWGSFIKDEPGEVNYIKGCCGNIKHFRPTRASLMNNISGASGYGYVNEKYLKQELSRLEEE